MATFSSTDARACRGSAISETLLVFPVAVIFMTLMMYVLTFWQDQEIDRSQAIAYEVARFNATPLLWFLTGDDDAKGEGVKDADDGFRPRYYVEEWQKDQPFGKHAKNVFYLSLRGEKSYNRRAMLIRGTATWMSFPFVRSQFKNIINMDRPATDEQTYQQKYLKSNYELDRINKLRKPLQLGS